MNNNHIYNQRWERIKLNLKIYNQRWERIKLNLKLEYNFMPYVLYNFLNFLQLFTYITKIKESNLILIIFCAK